MTALSLCLIIIGGFAIGFVCWKGCLIALNPISSSLFDLESLEPIGVRIVRGAVLLFLVCATLLALTIYPISLYILFGAPSPYLGASLSFAASFLGYLCLSFARHIIDGAIKLGKRAKTSRQKRAL
ncbi:MAG: hypothetical protein LBI57_06965 [Helicobacteraceae bacterium]|jgi:hypothetical protein|nr:hypothetical protein [Helicobacteraceae bacterium]